MCTRLPPWLHEVALEAGGATLRMEGYRTTVWLDVAPGSLAAAPGEARREAANQRDAVFVKRFRRENRLRAAALQRAVAAHGGPFVDATSPCGGFGITAGFEDGAVHVWKLREFPGTRRPRDESSLP